MAYHSLLSFGEMRAESECSPMSMSRQEAIEFLVDHYQNPRNRGPLEDADVHLTGGNPGCSDRVEMYAKVGEDGRVEAVSLGRRLYDQHGGCLVCDGTGAGH